MCEKELDMIRHQDKGMEDASMQFRAFPVSSRISFTRFIGEKEQLGGYSRAGLDISQRLVD